MDDRAFAGLELDIRLHNLQSELRRLENKRRNRCLVCVGTFLLTCWSLAVMCLLPGWLQSVVGFAVVLPLGVATLGVSVYALCMLEDLHSDIVRAYQDLRKLQTGHSSQIGARSHE